MTADRWTRLSPLIDKALDLPASQRRLYYDRLRAEDRALGAEVEALVDDCDSADFSFLDAAAAEGRDLLFEDAAPERASAAVMEQLQASFGTTFTIERELGGGGMSRVFLAREAGLNRQVVIKLLAPELTARINAERFEREIELAASLQQANIVPLLAAGRCGDLPYYTMPFVEGRSLREHLAREGALPIRDAVNILRDIARALAYAHARGVVHRDIKPGNVLLSGGTAVVSDFGIAKALTAARGGRSKDGLTQGGVGIGTRAYMAPEQAAGDPGVDHRADIYAFGCIAFEVVTGAPPFHGRRAHEVVAAHFREVPPPLTNRRGDVPPAMASLVARCLEKDPRRRPQSAAELTSALDAIIAHPHAGRARSSKRALIVGSMLAAAAIVGVGGRFLLHSSRGRAAQPATPAAGTANAEALDQYRLGQALVRERGDGVTKGVEYFEHAIALDPGFASAHAALSTALVLFPYFVGEAPGEVRDRATAEALRALEIDSTLAEPHIALGEIYAANRRWDLAVPEFKRAIALEPDSLAPYVPYFRFAVLRGETRPALAALAQARRIAPVSALVSAWTSYALFLDGHTDAALAENARAIQLDSTLLPATNLGTAMRLAVGDTAAARRMVAIPQPAGVMSDAPYVYAKLGDTATAWRLVRGMKSNDPRPWFTDVAQASILLAVGDTARALRLLEHSSDASGGAWAFYLPPRDPMYDAVRHSPRFAALVAKAGLNVPLNVAANVATQRGR